MAINRLNPYAYRLKKEDFTHRRIDINHRSCGSMLAMIVLIGGIVIMIVVIGLLVSILFLSQKRVQGQAEELALSMASVLNKDDLAGQMNNMVDCARELVFTSRNTYYDIANNHPRMKPLATQLLSEARVGAQLIESERQQLARYSVDVLNKLAKTNSLQRSNSMFQLPWLTTHPATIYALDAGYIERVNSNVKVPLALPELKDHDIESKFLDVNTGLYLANINARLPAPDDDLNFKLSSLPSLVRNTVSPARLTPNNTFRSLVKLVDQSKWVSGTCDQLPSAVRLVLAMQVSSHDGAKQNFVKRTPSNTLDLAKTQSKENNNASTPPLEGQVNTTVSATTSGGMELP